MRAATFINSGSKWFRHFAVDAMSGRDRDRFHKYESGAPKTKKHKLTEEFDKTQKEVLEKHFPKEAVKQEVDFYLVLDSNVACAAKTDDESDNDGNEPLTALSSAANSPNFEIRGSECGYFENISAENNLCPEFAKDIYDPGNWEHVTVLYVICWFRKVRSGYLMTINIL